MSTTAVNPATASIKSWLNTLVGFYCKDLAALSDEALNTSPGGVARTPVDYTCELVRCLHWTAGLLRGENSSMDTPDDEVKAMEAAHNTGPKLIAAMEAAGADLGAALDSVSSERLAEVVMSPFGMEMPVVGIVNVFVNHVWYHDGQLNMLQAMGGDEKVHWM